MRTGRAHGTHKYLIPNPWSCKNIVRVIKGHRLAQAAVRWAGRWEQDVIVSRGQGQVMSQEFQDRLEKLTGDLIAQESMTSP